MPGRVFCLLPGKVEEVEEVKIPAVLTDVGTRFKGKLAGNMPAAIATIAVIAGVPFLASADYRWIGHSIISMSALGLLIVTLVCGAILARRIRRPPNRNRFHFHRKSAISMGLLMAAALGYGFWMYIADNVRPLNSFHMLGGLVLLAMTGALIATGLCPRRPRRKCVHRWLGYFTVSVVVVQLAFGFFSTPLFKGDGEHQTYLLRWETLLEETWRPDGIISPGEYFTTLTLAEGYEASYRTDGESIYVGLRVNTTGWVGIGISNGNGMKNADGVVAQVTGSGEVRIEDSFGVSRVQFVADVEVGGTNDIIEFGGKEENGATIIEFKRTITTGDRFDSPLVTGKQTVIWAYGNNDDPGMHMVQGYISIYLEPGET
ncbi:MAG: hypothetical protein HYX91_03055 [Chloroflexi bacterium]|nr:hypothetical protein [Chloroflexota bacterium]